MLATHYRIQTIMLSLLWESNTGSLTVGSCGHAALASPSTARVNGMLDFMPSPNIIWKNETKPLLGVTYLYYIYTCGVHIDMWKYIHAYIYTHKYMIMYIYMCIYIYICKYIFIIYIFIYLHIHTYIYMYAYLYIYIHTCMWCSIPCIVGSIGTVCSIGPHCALGLVLPVHHCCRSVSISSSENSCTLLVGIMRSHSHWLSEFDFSFNEKVIRFRPAEIPAFPRWIYAHPWPPSWFELLLKQFDRKKNLCLPCPIYDRN